MKALAASVYAAGVVLCACSAAPRRELPVAEIQQSWLNETEPATGEINPAWWQSFHDPVLDTLIARAEARNLDLRLAQALVREARGQRDAATAELFPRLDGSANVSRGRQSSAGNNNINLGGAGGGNVSGNGGGGLRDQASVNANASWELDLFGRLRSTRRAAAAGLQASEADRDAVRLTLLTEVARSYVEYRLYRAQLELGNKTASTQQETLRITRVRYEQGLGSRLDVERATSLVATTRAQVPLAQELADSAFHRLVLLTAGTPETLTEVLPENAATLPDSDVQSVLLSPAQVLGQRPDVRAAERRLLAATETRRATQALRYPQLNLSALIGLQSDKVGNLLDDGTHTWSVGGGLLAPLFDFGRIRAAIDVADARQEQAYLSYERSVRTALQEAQTALVLYTQGKLRQQELSRAVDSGRAAAYLARRQYTEGALSLLEVLDAERSAFDAELSWSQATAEVSLRLVSLYQTMGVIPPQASSVASVPSSSPS